MKLFALALVITILSGCASTEEVIGPDGTSHQLVSCVRISECYQESKKVCNGKYRIINSSSETSGSEGAISNSTKLLIRCEPSS